MYRIDTLLKEKNRLFHTADLRVLWEIENKNTLYTAIKRYVQKGILIPVHKGFYSTVPLDEINPYVFLGGFLHSFCYISCETVLAGNGAIFQKSNYITAVSPFSKKFSLNNQDYLVRRMKDPFLYNLEGISDKGDFYQASLERAVADQLYYNPDYYFDNKKIINWKKVKKIQKEVGFI